MKKICLILALILCVGALPVFAQSSYITVNGQAVDLDYKVSDDGQIYVSAGAIMQTLGIEESILPVHISSDTTTIQAAAYAARMSLSINEEAAVLTSWQRYIPDTSKTYAVLNNATGKAMTLHSGRLTAEPFTNSPEQVWSFSDRGNGKYAFLNDGAECGIFELYHNSDGTGIRIYVYYPGYAKYMEETVNGIRLISDRDTPLQSWTFREADVIAADEKTAVYYSITAEDGNALSYDPEQPMREALSLKPFKGEATQLWSFRHTLSDTYIIESADDFTVGENRTEKRCLDVLNHLSDPGVTIIAYLTAGGPNQRWALEKQDNGLYLIKSELSGYYLTEKDGALSQEELGAEGNQYWKIEIK